MSGGQLAAAQDGQFRALISEIPDGEAVIVTSQQEIMHSDPDILGGTPVFVGTRVPVQSLFDYLEGGETLDEFLHQFPSVTRSQALTALNLARSALLARARPA